LSTFYSRSQPRTGNETKSNKKYITPCKSTVLVAVAVAWRYMER